MKSIYGVIARILFGAGLLGSIQSLSAQEIEGYITNPAANQPLYLIYTSEQAMIKDSVASGELPAFRKTLKLKHAAYVKLSYSRYSKTLYLFPGGRFRIWFDGSADSLFRASFRITGDLQINRYLDSIARNEVHYKYITNKVDLKQPIDSFAGVLVNFRRYADSVRHAFFLGHHQNMRLRQLHDFLLTDSINWNSYSILSAIDYSRSFLTGDHEKFWQQEVVNRVRPLPSQQAVMSDYYATMWFFYMRHAYTRATGNPIENKGFPGFVLEYIRLHTLPQKVKELLARRLLYNMAEMYTYRSLEQNKFYDSVIVVFRAMVPSAWFLEQFDGYYTAQQELLYHSLPGKKAPDFSLQDTAGKVYTLSDFKGKIVLIDVWATWCKPCLDELPYLHDLEQRLKGREFVLVSISLDDSRQNWMRDGIDKHALSGWQLWEGTEKGFSKLYNVYTIPLLVLLDQKGNFIQYNPPRASEGDKLYQLIRANFSIH